MGLAYWGKQFSELGSKVWRIYAKRHAMFPCLNNEINIRKSKQEILLRLSTITVILIRKIVIISFHITFFNIHHHHLSVVALI